MKFISSKTIVSSSKITNPENWFGYIYNMNIYRGCCHGCIYCDSRSECYQIKDFDVVAAKENALQLIESELKSKRTKGIIGTGAMSDPYNPFEKKQKLTRGALKLIDKYGFGINLTTKSDLVTRDIDIIKNINTHSPASVGITITTSDDEMASKIEPNVVNSSKRFAALNELSKNGIYTGILMMPILPFITDSEENIIAIVEKASEVGADFIYPSFGMTNRTGQKEYFYHCLDKYFPGIKEKYKTTFKDAYSCPSLNHKILEKRFIEACEDYHIKYKMKDIICGTKNNVKQKQISFFTTTQPL